MFKAIAIKELRELAGIVAVGVIALAYMLAMYTGAPLFPLSSGIPTSGVPFVTDTFTYVFGLVVGALGVALGLKQTVVEGRHGLYYFLLHRPVSRRFIFGAKMAIGGGLLLTAGAGTILLYAFWAATPGKSATPFAWSMTEPAWMFLWCIGIAYLGAFLSGLRPARWFGTRLLPLVAALVLAPLALTLPWWWLRLTLIAGIASWIVVAIYFYAEQRDY